MCAGRNLTTTHKLHAIASTTRLITDTASISVLSLTIMTAITGPSHPPAEVIKAIIRVTKELLIPITRESFANGGAPFGGAVLDQNLSSVMVAVNAWRECPIFHGETNCIRKFYQLPEEERPEPSTCIFFSTHEPCPLCLSSFAWTEFKVIYHLFTYKDSEEMLGVTGDVEIIEEVFRVRAPTDTDESLAARPLYNRRNKFFSVVSIAELLELVQDSELRRQLAEEVQSIRDIYDEFRRPSRALDA
jgi:tRNA(Arg) A34 adenosine deaminase TadA